MLMSVHKLTYLNGINLIKSKNFKSTKELTSVHSRQDPSYYSNCSFLQNVNFM